MRDDQKIVADDGESELNVGDTVVYYEDDTTLVGEIITITDFDVDMNDETMRAEMSNPRITVRLPDGSTTEFTTTNYSTPNPYDESQIEFISDELEKST